MSEQEKEKPKEGEVWTCMTCSEHPEFANAKLVTNHLVAAHSGHVRPQGKLQMLSHMDGSDWYGGADQWTFDFGNGPVEIINSYRYQRRGEDAAWWGNGPE